VAGEDVEDAGGEAGFFAEGGEFGGLGKKSEGFGRGG